VDEGKNEVEVLLRDAYSKCIANMLRLTSSLKQRKCLPDPKAVTTALNKVKKKTSFFTI